MKFVRYILLMLLSLPLFAQAATIDKTDPYLMMREVSQMTFARLKAEQPKIQNNPEVLRDVVREELLPYINTRYAAYKVLGPQLKKTSKQQRNNFVAAFTDYLVASYAQVLTQYTDQDIEIEPRKNVPANRSIVSVRVDILDTKRPPIRLDFKLRKNKKTNEWQGYDMVAEGVSMISTKQSEWSGQLRTEGVDAVTANLKQLAAKPIRREEKIMNKPKIEWRVQKNGYYCLSGELDRDTVPAFWQQRHEWMPQDAKVTLDLSALVRVDSAGMVMLLHVYQQLRSKDCELVLLNVPGQLKTLLRLSHVESMLAACTD